MSKTEGHAIIQQKGIMLLEKINQMLRAHQEWVICNAEQKQGGERIDIDGYEFIEIVFGMETLYGAKFKNCKFHRCIFDDGLLRDVVFDECEFYGGNVINTDMSGTIFKGGTIGADVKFDNVTVNKETTLDSVLINTDILPFFAGAKVSGIIISKANV